MVSKFEGLRKLLVTSVRFSPKGEAAAKETPAREKVKSGRKLFTRPKASSPKSAAQVPEGANGKDEPRAERLQREEPQGAALEALVARYERLLQQQQRVTSNATPLTRELLAEAERQAASMRLLARREGEIEATRRISEAKEQAQQIVRDAQSQAQEIVKREVERTIEVAQRRAQIIEDRAKQLGQLSLMRAREDVQRYVTGEAKEAYYRLLTALQEVISTAQTIQGEWKESTVRLHDISGSELDEYQAAMFNSLNPGQMMGAPEVEMVVTHAVTDDPTTAATGPPLVESDSFEVKDTAPNLGQLFGAPDAEVVVTPDVTDEPASAATGPPLVEADRFEVEETAPALRADMGATPDQSGIEKPLGAADVREAPDVTLSEATAALEVRAAAAGKEKETVASHSASMPARPNLYSGEVELVVEAFSDVAATTQFYKNLHEVSGLKVVRIAGTWDRGTTITVVLDQPAPLADLLLSKFGIQASPVGEGDRSSLPLGDKSRNRPKLAIALNAQQPSSNGDTEASPEGGP